MSQGHLHHVQSQNRDEPDASLAIAAHLARTRFEDLPASVVTAAKASILDTLGCVLAGTPCDDVVAIRKVATAWGGSASSTLIGSGVKGGVKLPAASAVLGNGAAIHQFDFDDTHDVAVMHPSSASLMPALALAEQLGGTGGKAIITAVALANDLSSRVGLAASGRMWDHPWFRAPVIGIFGATAAAAKIMNATAAQHVHALGLTLPQVSGTWASLHHKGSSVRSIRDGLAYRNGVLAAELAVNGIRGDGEVFDGPYGFYQAFFRGDYERAALLDGLGQRYETERISLKPWPCIRHLHTALTAVMELVNKNNLAFDDIKQVMLGLGHINVDRCRPVPTIAVSNGLALGGGCELAMICDMRVMAADATIGLTETRIGVIPGAGGTQRLPRFIGTAHALELMMTGEPISGTRAAEIGLVNWAVPADQLDAKAQSLASVIAGHFMSAVVSAE